MLLDPQGHRLAAANGNGELFTSRIAMELPVDGAYTLFVCGSNADQFGTYWLSLEAGLQDVEWSRLAAEAHYERGMQWAKQANSDKAASWMSLELGRFYAMRNQWDEAAKAYDLSLSLARRDKLNYCEWAGTVAEGRLFARRGRYDQAIGELQRAQSLSKDLRSSGEAQTITLVELGNSSPSSRNDDATRTLYYRTAEANAQEYALPATKAALYSSLSDLFESRDREKAFEYAVKAFSSHDELEPRLDLDSTYALAAAYLFLKPEKSEEGMQLAIQMRVRAQQVGCLDEEISSLTLMSLASGAKNQTSEVIRIANEALALTTADDENPRAKRVILQLLAEGETARHDFPAALAWCSKALQAVEGAWSRQAVEAARREILSESKAVCAQIIAILDEMNVRNPNKEYARQAFDYAERSRSRSLLEQLLTGGDESKMAVDPLMLRRDQDLIEHISAVRRRIAVMRTSSAPSREELYNLQEERVNLMAERVKLRADIGQSLGSAYFAAQLSPLDVDQAQKELAARHPNSAILYYQLAVQRSFLIILTPKQCHFVRLPDWTSIFKAVEEWSAAISTLQASPGGSSLGSYVQVARRLYDMVVKPGEKFVRGRELIIVPSEALSRLAFESLVIDEARPQRTSHASEYLIERHAVSYIPSVSVLAEIESRSERKPQVNQILLLGDASGGPGASRTVLRGPGQDTTLQQLPAAREEVLRIAGLAAAHDIQPTIWLGPEASETRFKTAELSAFRFIHIATHGISDHQDGEASALTLSPDQKQGQTGVLTSDEVSKLRLDADLVVLSGCETSVGEETGAEGIVGFNRNFLIAGARSVCGSLWQVEDSWTEKLMTELYNGLIVKQYNKSESLRLAKLAMLRQGANPSQWAPFVLSGSSR